MSEYYAYLVRTTWPDLLVLFFMQFIIWLKVVEISTKAWRSGRGRKALLPWLIKIIWWFGILGIYLIMFLPRNPDWLARPVTASGSIVEVKAVAQGKMLIQLAQKNEDSGQAEGKGVSIGEHKRESLREFTEEFSEEAAGYLVLYADSEFGSKVRLGDEVEVTYLPNKREIVKSVVMPSLK